MEQTFSGDFHKFLIICSIALTVLTGYVLDLRALFPCGPTTGGEVYWREYAVKLEKDYTALKTRFEEKEIRKSLH